MILRRSDHILISNLYPKKTKHYGQSQDFTYTPLHLGEISNENCSHSQKKTQKIQFGCKRIVPSVCERGRTIVQKRRRKMINLCADRKSFCSFMIFFLSLGRQRIKLCVFFFSLILLFGSQGICHICFAHLKKLWLKMEENISNMKQTMMCPLNPKSSKRKKRPMSSAQTQHHYCMFEKANLQISQYRRIFWT